MGCDYYTEICTCIVYKDESGNEQEFDTYEGRQSHYACRNPSADPDFVKPVDAVEEKCKEYGEKVLFENQIWTCTEYGKTRILELCKCRDINEADIIKVYKHMVGWWR